MPEEVAVRGYRGRVLSGNAENHAKIHSFSEKLKRLYKIRFFLKIMVTSNNSLYKYYCVTVKYALCMTR